jgi:hypothetical protein
VAAEDRLSDMNANEFRTLVGQRTDQELLELLLHADETPYVFETKPANWDTFRDSLYNGLGVPRANIKIIGSGRFGFSLSPWKSLGKFRDNSDIDVLMVSEALFDELWFALLRAAYPRYPITETLDAWLKDRRNEVYTGYLTPSDVKFDVSIVGSKGVPIITFTTRWFNALKDAARYPPRRHSDVEGRLYRTWQHADLYHLSSLASLRKAMAK